MFFGIVTSDRYIDNLNNFEIKELIKPTTTIILLSGTIRLGTVNKKTSLRLKDFKAYYTYMDQIQ